MSLYQAFVVAVVILVIVPGPDMAFIITMGVGGGPLAGLSAAFGVAVGLAVHALAAILGFAAIFAVAPFLYDVLRWAGAAYLIYLAIRTWVERDDLTVVSNADGAATISHWQAFRKAAVVNLLNPKVILFNAAFLPQFVDPAAGNVVGQFLVLGVTLVVVDLLIDGPIGLAAGHAGQVLRRSRRIIKALNVVTASVFLGLALRLVLVRD
ncbi:LysE family translocator [Micromonospora sp. NPDC000207]|uniref:LysE family translocator n=1 Tax=Micromonospora sp. NPDC000207 TaxID=3154246 RepID=UPI003326917C